MHRSYKSSGESSKSSFSKPKDKDEAPLVRDEWMNLAALIPTTEKTKKIKVKPDRGTIDSLGQSSRELNPYWKDGGSGLPSERKERDLHVSKSSVGDHGLDYYKRALQRAEEAAKDQGRPLEEIVSERWGSLDKLLALIKDASYHGRRNTRDSYHDRRNTRERNWVRKDVSTNESSRHRKTATHTQDVEPSHKSKSEKETKSYPMKKEEGSKVQCEKILTDDELNTLAAKLVKAEILGNSERITQLKAELASARKAREGAASNTTNRKEKETVVLLHSNAKGLTCPVKSSTIDREPTATSSKRAKRIETHKDKQRVRYFADDDKYTLQEMFQKEKLSSSNDDKALFVKMSSKKGRHGSDDEYDTFVDSARLEKTGKRKAEREMQQAISEAEKRRKTFDSCPWCLDNPERAKHLVVSIGESCYLCLPEEESLTDFHCLLVPREHCSSGTLLDENVWEEMHKFRQALWNMAQSLEHDLIIFEQARALHTHPHTVFHCIILEREVGDLAPIYFKKALLESDSEWAHNKKLVDIKNQDIRRTIPKGLPYFSVEFGTSGGFAHVIEDEHLFKKNFAHEVIGGMLDLDHRKWRKPTKMSFYAQRQKVSAFLRKWSKFDVTKETHVAQMSSSSSDSSSSSSSSCDDD